MIVTLSADGYTKVLTMHKMGESKVKGRQPLYAHYLGQRGSIPYVALTADAHVSALDAEYTPDTGYNQCFALDGSQASLVPIRNGDSYLIRPTGITIDSVAKTNHMLIIRGATAIEPQDSRAIPGGWQMFSRTVENDRISAFIKVRPQVPTYVTWTDDEGQSVTARYVIRNGQLFVTTNQ